MILPTQSKIKYVNLSRYINLILSGKEKLNVRKKFDSQINCEKLRFRSISLLITRRLMFSKLICHENRTSSNEIDEMRGGEYRSNLDRGQELIPAVRVDEENETIPPRS